MKTLAVRLFPGQYLKEEIEKMVIDNNIQAGVILSVVGGLENAVLRMGGSTPTDQKVKKWDGPFEIVSGTGTLSKDGCHIHISLSNQEGNVIGGHLKDGCIVKTTAEIVLGIFEDSVYKRVPDQKTGFDELKVE